MHTTTPVDSKSISVAAESTTADVLPSQSHNSQVMASNGDGKDSISSMINTAAAAGNTKSKGVTDFNELISCYLCKGYLIDATTIVECLHSFCRTCILKYLDDNTPKSRYCPKCEVQIHKTKPKVNIRPDPTLQDIVYKLVPGLFKNEMLRRKEFYLASPEKGLSNEERGEINGERLILSTDDLIQISIEYYPQFTNPYKLLPFNDDLSESVQSSDSSNQRRYLLCKGGMRVLHLKKLIRHKYGLSEKDEVDFFYKQELLRDDYSIIDLAYIYSWRRHIPIPLYYIIIEQNKSRSDYLLLSSESLNVSLALSCPKKPIRRRLSSQTPLTHVKKIKLKNNTNLVPRKSLPSANSTTSSSASSIESTNPCQKSESTKPMTAKCKPSEPSTPVVKAADNPPLDIDDSSTDISEKSFHIDLDVQTDSPSKESSSENSLDSTLPKKPTESVVGSVNKLAVEPCESTTKLEFKSEITDKPPDKTEVNSKAEAKEATQKETAKPTSLLEKEPEVKRSESEEAKDAPPKSETVKNDEIKENGLSQPKEVSITTIKVEEMLVDKNEFKNIIKSATNEVGIKLDSCKTTAVIEANESGGQANKIVNNNGTNTGDTPIANTNLIRPFVFANIENTDDFKKLLYSQINSNSSNSLNLDDKVNHSAKPLKLDG